jgi:hypothetical protein
MLKFGPSIRLKMPKPILLIIENGKYCEAELKNNGIIPKRDEEKSYGFTELMQIGFPQDYSADLCIDYSEPLTPQEKESAKAFIRLGHKLQKDKSKPLKKENPKTWEEARQEAIGKSLEELLPKAIKHVEKIGAPFFLIQYEVKTEEHKFDEHTIIGQSYPSRHYLELKVQPYVRIGN